MELTSEQLRDLVSTGKVELGNGDVVRFTEEPDEYTRVGDYDCYGKVHHIWRGYGQSARPDGFDGMAEKIHTGRDEYWWQPPDDLRSGWATSEVRSAMRNIVREILTYGFSIYCVELCRGTNAYGDPIVVDFATMGGIEPLDDDDKVGYLVDLVAELSDTCVGVA